MLNTYFGFLFSPFENNLDQRFLFLSECHKEVIAALLYCIREKKGFALVCGDVGTGKTMIIHHVLGNLPRSVLPILIPYPDVEYIDILRYIARVLNINPEEKGVLELTDEVKSSLINSRLGGKQVVVIIDEAHLLSIDSLEYIRLLSNIETTDSKLVHIVLIGQNELSFKLRGKEMRQLRQRINVNRILSPMNPSETIKYIDHRLRIAGASFDKCFDPGCKKPLYKMTGGVPRSINRLCDTALLICMTERCERVTKKTLKKARDAIDSDMVHVQEARPRGAFSRAKKLRAVLAAAALILFLSLGVFGYMEIPGELLRAWFYGADARKQANTTVEKHQGPAFEVKNQDNRPAGAGKDNSSGNPPGAVDRPAVSSAASPEVPPGDAQTVNNKDESVTAQDTISPSGGEAGSSRSVVEKIETKEQTADKNPGTAQISEEGADRENTAESRTPDAVPEAHGAEEGAPGTSDFFIVTIKKGDSLSRIAARWFPEDPASGKESILAANPQIDDEDRILAGQTLRLPKSRATGLEDR